MHRDPRKKIATPQTQLAMLSRWREGGRRRRAKDRADCVAYEAGRDGFWLARWLHARGIEATSSTHQHPRLARAPAGEDRSPGYMLKALLGWLRGEAKHCSMVAVPTIEEEDAKRPDRERKS